MCSRVGQQCDQFNICCQGLYCINHNCSALRPFNGTVHQLNVSCIPSFSCNASINVSSFTNASCSTVTIACPNGCDNVTKRCNPCNTLLCCSVNACSGNESIIRTFINGTCVSNITHCQYGCNPVNGSCFQNTSIRKCNDTDGGIFPEIPGYILINGQYATRDSCYEFIGNNQISEKYCDNNDLGKGVTGQVITCPNQETCQEVTQDIPSLGPTQVALCR